MEFSFNIEKAEQTITVFLKGDLDASAAVGLMEGMKKLAGTPVKELIFDATELNYIASAGLRVIIFSKQKIGYDAEVMLKNPNETVSGVITMSGLNNFITVI